MVYEGAEISFTKFTRLQRRGIRGGWAPAYLHPTKRDTRTNARPSEYLRFTQVAVGNAHRARVCHRASVCARARARLRGSPLRGTGQNIKRHYVPD